MKLLITIVLLNVLCSGTFALPTLYEYYTSDGIKSGLSDKQPYFQLNNKNITIQSGALHYFRVPQQYWRDRLRKIRAAGLNTVETYVSWNLHEPQQGVFDFGQDKKDIHNRLNIEYFLQLAQEEDLFVLLRSGPYICAEWEFGGFPSWILRYRDMVVRTTDKQYLKLVSNYFKKLFSIVAKYQFTRGGPIIAFQVENEYGNTQTDNFTPQKEYLSKLVDILHENGVVELLYTSDSAGRGTVGSLPTLLQTANFARNPKDEFDYLNSFQLNKPTMAMEFWTGWYDVWDAEHSVRDNEDFKQSLNEIINYPASFNMYMFLGGTSFGFTSGANLHSYDNSQYNPMPPSYDYDAPLSENGNYTEKYYITREALKANQDLFLTPDMPEPMPTVKYEGLECTSTLPLSEAIKQTTLVSKSEHPQPMELYPINNNNGQTNGFIVYSKIIENQGDNLSLTIGGSIYDTIMVLLDDKLISPPYINSSSLDGFGYWRVNNSTLTLPKSGRLDLIVENMGRNNFGSLEQFKQYKGLQEDVYLNGQTLLNWTVTHLEFKKDWIKDLTNWQESKISSEPTLYKFVLEISKEPQDTYIDMSRWTKGLVIVNGFVLGRYFKVGAQQALYLPGVYLNQGTNEIIVFEQFAAGNALYFSDKMIYANP